MTFLHRKAARQSVNHILDWRPERLILAHGPLVERDAAGFIRSALDWAL
jgi:hypothetical protein